MFYFETVVSIASTPGPYILAGSWHEHEADECSRVFKLEMPNAFGQWPYLGIARLADEGRAVACEGDADGALSAWIGESLGLGRANLTDWLEHDDGCCMAPAACPWQTSPRALRRA